MKLLLYCLLAFLVIHSVCSQGSCEVFHCGEVTQPQEGKQLCVQKQENGEFNITRCPNGQTCQAFKWNSIYDEGNAFCGEETPEPIWGQFTPVFGIGLDGDYCEEDGHCHSFENDQAVCTNNRWVTSSKVGDFCKEAYDCPMGTYCSGSTCKELVKEGGSCQNSRSCGYGTTCIETNPDFHVGTWFRYGTFKEGHNFTVMLNSNEEAEEVPNYFTEVSDLWETGFQMHIDGQLQCRRGTRNKVQGREALIRDMPGQSCVVLFYDSVSIYDYTTPTERKDVVMSNCGFNQDSHAYCPLQPGDDEVELARKDYVEASQKFKCHKYSGYSKGSICGDLFDFQRSQKGWNYYLKSTYAGMSNFANIANDDECTADTIMQDFWQGHFKDSISNNILISE